MIVGSTHTIETKVKISNTKIVHGGTSYGRTSTYRSWEAMKARCYNAHNNKFLRYGGRGIKVCDRWANSFENFLTDMGKRPFGKTLDRLNGNGNYEPDNCRWATSLEQAQTRVYKKKTHCVNGHLFNEEATYIRPDKGTKQCKLCAKNRKKNGSTIFPKEEK